MRYLILTLLLALASAVAHAQVRCPDGSYRTACPGGGGEAVGAPLSTYSAPDLPERPRVQPRQQPRATASPQQQGMPPPPNRPRSVADRARDLGLTRNELVQALNRGTLIRGMERTDVDRIMGRPDDVERERIAGHDYENLWYRNSQRRWYRLIIMRDGRLHSSNANITER